jgi:predicted phage terminase large subunit-like protein
MAIGVIEWENLNHTEKYALKLAGEKSPLSFTSLWFNVTQAESFRTNWHHHYYDYAAQQMLENKKRCIVINIPPGGTKTEFFSIHLPVYCMAKFPRVRILNTCYSKDLVDENSNRSRAIVTSNEFKELYGLQLGKNKTDDWTVEKSGKRVHQIFSRSSGGQITGVRGGYMHDTFSGYVSADDWDKIDDLFSEPKRKKSHIRLVNTLRSRRAKYDTPFLFIQQRGHVDDSTAFMLAGGMALDVDLHIKIPALVNQEYIDSLPDGIRERCIASICHTEQVDGYWSYWPAKENVHDLLKLKAANPYTFQSQYMQEPDALDGGIFHESDFLYYGDTNRGADLSTPVNYEYRFITVDTAQKTKEHNDWTVFAEWGVYQNRLYRQSFYRGKLEASALEEKFTSFVNAAHAKNSTEMGALRFAAVEDKVSGTGLIQNTSKKLPVRVDAIQREKDKLTRAMDSQPYVASGRVVLPYGDAHNIEFVAEVASFTHDDTHKHDDQTDVMMDAVEKAFIFVPETPKGVLIPKHIRDKYK